MNKDDILAALGLDQKPKVVSLKPSFDYTSLEKRMEKQHEGFGIYGEEQLYDTCIKLDKWDLKRGQELVKKKTFQKIGENAAADFHGLCFRSKPQIQACVDKRREEYIKTLMESGDYKALHETTKLNKTASKLAATKIAEEYSVLLEQDELNKKESPDKKQIRLFCSVEDAIKEAEEEVEEYVTTVKMLGHGDGDPSSDLEAERLIQLYHRCKDNEKLHAIMELAGRYTASAMAKQQQKTNFGYDDMIGITLDGDVSKLVDQELMYLCDEDLQWDLLPRLIENRAMCREYIGYEKLGKGPIVISVDESGSMDGTPLENAKAFTLAMGRIAKHQQRWLVLIGYSGRTQGNLLAMPPNQWNDSKLIDWLLHNFGCGTDMDVPLIELPNIWWPKFLEQGMPKGRTDLIIISDAECVVSNEIYTNFMAWKKQEQVRCLSMIIGGCDAGGLKDVSDEVFLMEEISVNSQAVQSAFSI